MVSAKVGVCVKFNWNVAFLRLEGSYPRFLSWIFHPDLEAFDFESLIQISLKPSPTPEAVIAPDPWRQPPMWGPIPHGVPAACPARTGGSIQTRAPGSDQGPVTVYVTVLLYTYHFRVSIYTHPARGVTALYSRIELNCTKASGLDL